MSLVKLVFGVTTKQNRQDAEALVEGYLSVLFHNGQLCGEYYLVTEGGALTAYVNETGARALMPKWHSSYGVDRLSKVTAFFGHQPERRLIDDDAGSKDVTWQGASFLYLCDCTFEAESPLRRGDNGLPIPLYRLTGTHEDREAIYYWQCAYRDYYSIWMGCGDLEKSVYRQMADPSSELSQQGTEICRFVEKATGVPAYYFLMRYWGRKKGEGQRKCPSCGQGWLSKQPADASCGFWQFPFRCARCRLVSHTAESFDDERSAAIGEWRRQRTRR